MGRTARQKQRHLHQLHEPARGNAAQHLLPRALAPNPRRELSLDPAPSPVLGGGALFAGGQYPSSRGTSNETRPAAHRHPPATGCKRGSRRVASPHVTERPPTFPWGFHAWQTQLTSRPDTRATGCRQHSFGVTMACAPKTGRADHPPHRPPLAGGEVTGRRANRGLCRPGTPRIRRQRPSGRLPTRAAADIAQRHSRASGSATGTPSPNATTALVGRPSQASTSLGTEAGDGSAALCAP